MRRRRAAAYLLVLATTLGLTACWGPSSSVVSADCGWLESPATQGEASSQTVVLVDRSSSYRRSGTGREGIVAAVIDAALQDFGRPGVRVVSVGVFDSSSSTVQWAVRQRALPLARGSRERLQEQDRQAARTCLHEAVDVLTTEPAERPSTDVLGALFAGRAQFDGRAATTRHMVVFTDGLTNTGCADLRTTQNPEDLVRGCKLGNALPQLEGIELTITGVGEPAASMAVLTTDQSQRLKDLWAVLCRATGAAPPPSGRSCLKDLGGGEGAGQTEQIDGAQEPAVIIEVPRVVLAGPEITLDVPSDLLFATDSYTLTATAAARLHSLVVGYARKPHRGVTVVGHTDSRGSATYNVALSHRRAATVRAVLADAGFRGVTAAGRGESRPRCLETVRGRPDPSCMSRNRRVEITIMLQARS